MSATKYLIIVGVFAVSLISSVRSDACHLRELDLCSASAAGIKGVPVTDADIDKYCGLAKEAVECIRDFTEKCTTPLQKEIMALAVGSGHKEQGEKFCTKGDEQRNNYLKHAPCLAKAQAESKSCMTDGQAALERLEEAPFKDKITTACCAYARYKKCSHDIVEATCGAEAIEYGNKMIHMVSSNLIDVLCSGFDNNPSCASLLPPPGTPPKGNGKSMISKLIATYSKS